MAYCLIEYYDKNQSKWSICDPDLKSEKIISIWMKKVLDKFPKYGWILVLGKEMAITLYMVHHSKG